MDGQRAPDQMEFELGHISPPGLQFIELAEKHATQFAMTADAHDKDGTFPFGNWEEMRRSGFLAGAVPVGLGGLGVTAVHDLVVAISRLARGDAATAIGAAMHTTAFWYLARLLEDPAGSAGDERFTAGLRLLLRRCGRGRAIACVAISESGTSLGYPLVVADHDGGGYRVSGRKTFCTNSPAATVFLSSVRIPDPDGGPGLLGFAVIPRGTAGVSVVPNWDALGMRASGSGEVIYSSCSLPDSMVAVSGPVGVLSPRILPLTMTGALVLAGAFLGIAERSQAIAVDAVARGKPGAAVTPLAERTAVTELIGHNEVDLAASRALLSRVALLLDERLPPAGRPGQGMHSLMREVQCANIAVKRAAISIVDRSLTLSGGRGYLSSHPLSRLYRDVRAGPFMQPFSDLDVFEFIGRARLGQTGGRQAICLTCTVPFTLAKLAGNQC